MTFLPANLLMVLKNQVLKPQEVKMERERQQLLKTSKVLWDKWISSRTKQENNFKKIAKLMHQA